MAEERELRAMGSPQEQAPAKPADAVAKVEGVWLNREQAVAWLKSEEARAKIKSKDEAAGHNIRGCFAQMEACKKLRLRIAAWGSGKATAKQKADEAAALAEPLDLHLELAALKEEIL